MPSFDSKPTVLVRDREFLRDLRYALRPHLNVPIGQLDEAIALGLGFNTRAALLAKLDATLPLEMVVEDHKFRARLHAFQASAPEGLFQNIVLDQMENTLADVRVGFSDDQRKARGRVKVRLTRIPSLEELDNACLEYETFMSAFRDHVTSTDSMVATAIDLGEVVDIDGLWIPVGANNTWLVVVGPA